MDEVVKKYLEMYRNYAMEKSCETDVAWYKEASDRELIVDMVGEIIFYGDLNKGDSE